MVSPQFRWPKHCLGYSAAARIADPLHPEHIAEWLLEESVSLSGEHIGYQYQAEDEQGIDEPSIYKAENKIIQQPVRNAI